MRPASASSIPRLRNRPVVVLSNNDGCIVARSRKQKPSALKMGEPYFKVKELLDRHKVAVFSSNYTLYGDMSQRVMKTLQQFSPEVEIYSIDEAFLNLEGFRDLPDWPGAYRETVRQWTGHAGQRRHRPDQDAGKVANNTAKKKAGYNGVCVLDTPTPGSRLLDEFEVGDVWGIGTQYKKLLNRKRREHGAGVFTAAGNLAPQAYVRRRRQNRAGTLRRALP